MLWWSNFLMTCCLKLGIYLEVSLLCFIFQIRWIQMYMVRSNSVCSGLVGYCYLCIKNMVGLQIFVFVILFFFCVLLFHTNSPRLESKTHILEHHQLYHRAVWLVMDCCLWFEWWVVSYLLLYRSKKLERILNEGFTEELVDGLEGILT